MDFCVTCGKEIKHREHGDGFVTPFKHWECRTPTRAQEDAYWRDVNLRADEARGA